MRIIRPSARARRVILNRRQRLRIEILEKTLRDRNARITELEARLAKK